ncbi:RNA polymerase sigma factor [Streptomyces phaeochromogenes]
MNHTASPAGADQGDPWSAPASASWRTLRNFREADLELYELLLKDGFQGPKQEVLEARLVTSSRRALGAWIFTGEIYKRVKGIGRPVSPESDLLTLLREDPEARDDLALETIVTALPLFRKQLREGKWDFEQGSLTTYFLGAVVRSFPNVYRGWVRRNAATIFVEPVGITPEDFSLIDLPRVQDDIGASIEGREVAEYFFKLLKSPDREIAKLAYEGTPTSEIAEQFKVTPDAIRRRLHRMRDTAVKAGLA